MRKASVQQPAEDNDYASLRSILDEAYAQASAGKGKERHANDRPFDEQPIHMIGEMVGIGFNAGQAMKKAQEAVGMHARGETDKAVHEMLGVIVYAAATINLMRR
jgi:hypothetical protein